MYASTPARRFDQCGKCQASVMADNWTAHSKWHTEVEKGIQMARVLWCDLGDHAYKAGAPGSQTLHMEQRDEFGNVTQVEMDVCGEHAFPNAMNNPTMRAVETAYKQSTAPHHNQD